MFCLTVCVLCIFYYCYFRMQNFTLFSAFILTGSLHLICCCYSIWAQSCISQQNTKWKQDKAINFTMHGSNVESSQFIPSMPRLSKKKYSSKKNWLHMATQLQNLRFSGFSYCFSFVLLFFFFFWSKAQLFFPAVAARKVTQNPKLIQFVFSLLQYGYFAFFVIFCCLLCTMYSSK